MISTIITQHKNSLIMTDLSYDKLSEDEKKLVDNYIKSEWTY